MSAFIWLYVILSVTSFLEINNSPKQHDNKKFRVYFWICFIIIAFVGVFRAEIYGVDIQQYKNAYFDYWRVQPFFSALTSGVDFGYNLLNWAVGQFTGDFWVFKTVVFLFCLISVALWIRKYSEYPALSLSLFCILGLLGFSFCILRQSVALSISVWTFGYVKEKRLLPFMIVTGVASCFHITAAALILFYFTINFNFSKNSFIKKSVIILSVIALSGLVIPQLITIYARIKTDYTEQTEFGHGLKILLFYAILFVILSYYKNRVKDSSSYDVISTEYDMSFIVIYFQISAVFFSLFSRVVNYALIYLVLFIPCLLKEYPGRKKLSPYLLVWALLTFIYFYRLIFADDLRIVPYISIWG